MKIFLVGFMGSGKSFLGKELATFLEYRHFDIDEMIVNNKKKSVNQIFSERGEKYFRSEESRTVRSIISDKVVISTGGGLPCFHDNMGWMNDSGVTVYLEASLEFLFNRLSKEKESRPLISELSDSELKEFIISKLTERREYYEKAKIILDAEKTNAEKLKEKILSLKGNLA